MYICKLKKDNYLWSEHAFSLFSEATEFGHKAMLSFIPNKDYKSMSIEIAHMEDNDDSEDTCSNNTSELE